MPISDGLLLLLEHVCDARPAVDRQLDQLELVLAGLSLGAHLELQHAASVLSRPRRLARVASCIRSRSRSRSGGGCGSLVPLQRDLLDQHDGVGHHRLMGVLERDINCMDKDSDKRFNDQTQYV